ncbi:hypothetical protein MAR_034997 [Mya arenaria]|uniref:Uncharacterized protein n=1 Tax=Mya arenaria TaxID=6604 RepID=A0ABY7EMG6_MYAAR|nr:hypothetical protein MAR_034997 [Mya arenaria]
MELRILVVFRINEARGGRGGGGSRGGSRSGSRTSRTGSSTRTESIAGIVVGVIIACVAIAVFVYCCIIKRRRRAAAAAKAGIVITKPGNEPGMIPLNSYSDQPQPPMPPPGGMMPPPPGGMMPPPQGAYNSGGQGLPYSMSPAGANEYPPPEPYPPGQMQGQGPIGFEEATQTRDRTPRLVVVLRPRQAFQVVPSHIPMIPTRDTTLPLRAQQHLCRLPHHRLTLSESANQRAPSNLLLRSSTNQKFLFDRNTSTYALHGSCDDDYFHLKNQCIVKKYIYEIKLLLYK